jgi:hypothetical protein
LTQGLPPEASITVETTIRTRFSDDFNQFLNPPNFYANQTASQLDEYENYLKVLAAPYKRPLVYWSKQQKKWPSLYRMALNVLSIPLINTKYERIFSACNYLITARRNHMKDDIIKALTCLRAWLKEG